MKFTPLQNFHDAGSDYLVGLNYTVRAQGDTPLDKTQLYAKVQVWIKDGRVRLGQSDPQSQTSTARVKGAGSVS